MKKLIIVCAAALIVLGVSALSWAAEPEIDPMDVRKDIVVSFDVTDLFGLQIWATDYVQTLADVEPGGAAVGDIHIYATSNHGLAWVINGESAGMVGTTQVLPVEINTFDGTDVATQGPVGTFVEDLQLTSSPAAIYTAAGSEYTVRGLQIGCVYVVPTTIETKADTYAGTITLTMTE